MQTQQQSQAGDRQDLEEIGRRHGFGRDAVEVMLDALRRGNGTMAQFSHPEFSGSGQWMRGGMTMVSDLFDDRLKSRVASLCEDLSAWLARQPPPARGSGDVEAGGGSGGSGHWWPEGLSNPSSSGSQNGQRYAYFPDQRRLAVDIDGEVSVYDTRDHRIGGVSQQQSGSGSMKFQSQHGTVDTRDLPLVSRSGSRSG